MDFIPELCNLLLSNHLTKLWKFSCNIDSRFISVRFNNIEKIIQFWNKKMNIQVHTLIFQKFPPQNWSKRDTYKGEYRENEINGEGTCKWTDSKKYVVNGINVFISLHSYCTSECSFSLFQNWIIISILFIGLIYHYHIWRFLQSYFYFFSLLKFIFFWNLCLQSEVMIV